MEKTITIDGKQVKLKATAKQQLSDIKHNSDVIYLQI